MEEQRGGNWEEQEERSLEEQEGRGLEEQRGGSLKAQMVPAFLIVRCSGKKGTGKIWLFGGVVWRTDEIALGKRGKGSKSKGTGFF